MDPPSRIGTSRQSVHSPVARLAHSLTESPSRVVLALPSSPPSNKHIPLPPIAGAIDTDSSASTSDTTEEEGNDNDEEADNDAAMNVRPTMLLDYLSRLGKFEPRLRRYVASKYTEHREPVLAFANASTPATSSGAYSPATPAPQTVAQSSAVRGFSLVDLERALLSATTGWWKGSSNKTSSKTSSWDHDSDRLDIDLSGIFGAPAESEDSNGAEPSGPSGDPKLPQPPTDKGVSPFLNYWTHEELIAILESAGIISSLADVGFNSISLIFDTSDQFQHRLSLIDSSLFTNPELRLSSSERYLIDLHMKRRTGYNTDASVSWQLMNRLVKARSWEGLREMTGEIRSPYVPLEGAKEVKEFLEKSVEKYRKLAKKGSNAEGFDMTEICWLQMHNPLSDDPRPLLPGQRFPGLGLGRKIAATMERMGQDSHVTDGLWVKSDPRARNALDLTSQLSSRINFPMFWHNSAAYSPRGWRYLDPVFEAYVDFITESLKRYMDEHGIAFVAWAVTHGHLRRITLERPRRPTSSDSGDAETEWKEISSRLERWAPSEQVFPTSPAMQAWFNSSEWRGLYNKWSKRFAEDGGAHGEGVSVVGEMKEGMERKCTLVIDVDAATELWKYSKVLWTQSGEEPALVRKATSSSESK